jgi:hypothetical protein
LNLLSSLQPWDLWCFDEARRERNVLAISGCGESVDASMVSAVDDFNGIWAVNNVFIIGGHRKCSDTNSLVSIYRFALKVLLCLINHHVAIYLKNCGDFGLMELVSFIIFLSTLIIMTHLDSRTFFPCFTMDTQNVV